MLPWHHALVVKPMDVSLATEKLLHAYGDNREENRDCRTSLLTKKLIKSYPNTKPWPPPLLTPIFVSQIIAVKASVAVNCWCYCHPNSNSSSNKETLHLLSNSTKRASKFCELSLLRTNWISAPTALMISAVGTWPLTRFVMASWSQLSFLTSVKW